MTFDGLFTKWMTDEIRPKIIGGRISKIRQPLPYEIQMTIRSNRENYQLLYSIHPTMARFQFLSQKAESNDSTPNFCILLRKHLEGAIIHDFKQVKNDRIIEMDLDTKDEIGDQMHWRLTLEMMGRHSNLFLMHQSSKKIVDCLKHVPLYQNSFRTLQPGAIYVRPPQSDQLNPFTVSLLELDTYLQLHLPEHPAEKDLCKLIQGMSLETANEIFYRAERTDKTIAEALYRYIQEGEEKRQPTLFSKGTKSYFLPFSYQGIHPDSSQTFNSLSELLETYYARKVQSEKVQQIAGNLIQKLKTELKKNREKLIKLDEDLVRSEKAEQYRIYGDLLNTFLYKIEKNQDSIILENYYDQDRPLEIPLSKRLTPVQNAQFYYKKYQKLKNARTFIEEQKRHALQEIDYLETTLLQIEDSDAPNLETIKEDLVQNGYLKKNSLAKQKGKTKNSEPYEFWSTDGTRILVGRNNIQNDQLTLKKAKKNYLWLHAKNIPGSHVIVESEHPNEETIGQAAMLAAYYSKFRYSGTVPVDYVPVSHIKKPNGAKPGFVIYEGQENTYITPDEATVQSLRENRPKNKIS